MKNWAIIVFLLWSVPLLAQPKDAEIEIKEGKKYYVHIVQTGNSLWGIHTLYNVPVDDIVATNAGVENGIKDGQKLLIPVVGNLTSDKSKPGIKSEVKHTVQAQETLYGISKTETEVTDKNITKMIFDMRDNNILEDMLLTVNPDIVIHLASISSSYHAFNNPIETLQCNGMLTAHLCDIIYRNNMNTKLFNASSSEIYKGHVNYLVKEDDKYMHHLHPYSISKMVGHSMVDFYRNTYGLPFSNGVIFTTESEYKRPEFLLTKVKLHAKTWNDTKQPLKVGSLDSYRNILHADDVACAIHTIIQQKKGDNYLICNDFSVKIYDLVLQIYSSNGIELENRNNILYDVNTGLEVVIIENKKIGFDLVPTDIRGECKKLKELGWKPTRSIF